MTAQQQRLDARIRAHGAFAEIVAQAVDDLRARPVGWSLPLRVAWFPAPLLVLRCTKVPEGIVYVVEAGCRKGLTGPKPRLLTRVEWPEAAEWAG